MAKYSFDVRQVESEWVADIVRRVSARKTLVSKQQVGFSSESEALAWANETLMSFKTQQSERNDRRAKQRQLEQEKAEARKKSD